MMLVIVIIIISEGYGRTQNTPEQQQKKHDTVKDGLLGEMGIQFSFRSSSAIANQGLCCVVTLVWKCLCVDSSMATNCTLHF